MSPVTVEEEDCGFVFRRKNPKIEPAVVKKSPGKPQVPKNIIKAAPVKATKVAPVKAVKGAVNPPKNNATTKRKSAVPAKIPIATKTTPANKTTPVATPRKSIGSTEVTPSKRKIMERQRRRSSLSGMTLPGRRRSSIGIGLTHDLPPANVESSSYHKHILPDLPGPIKMRQLLVWAVQKAAKECTAGKGGDGRDLEEMIGEPLVQALHTNDLNTSWYQRPPTGNPMSLRPNPVNLEMKECLGLYQRYHGQLSAEMGKWKALEGNSQANYVLPKLDFNDEVSTSSLELMGLNKWACRLPLSIDRLGWLLSVYGSFEQHSKDFCEGVFKQIFNRFFANKHPATAIEPIQILKALSAAS